MSIPSFLMPLTTLSVVNPSPIGGRSPTVLPFQMEKQIETEWCWAATAESISKYYSSASTWTQCDIASVSLSLTCCTTPHPCNMQWYLDQALSHTDNFAGYIPSNDSFSGVVNEINKRQPVCCHISWAGGGGHFLAIRGYDIIAQDLYVDDPIYGRTTIPYNGMLGSYQFGGTWDWTYLTRPPLSPSGATSSGATS